jgi:hypothetical protein
METWLHRTLAQDDGYHVSSQILERIGRSSGSLKITQRRSRRKSSSPAFRVRTDVQEFADAIVLFSIQQFLYPLSAKFLPLEYFLGFLFF